MGLTGKVVRQVEIKSDGDMYHELFCSKQHHISGISPQIVRRVDLHGGNWGTAGSILQWNYIQDGQHKCLKDVVEAIDEKKKTIRYKVIEGDLLEEFKSFALMVHMETKGTTTLVTWTAEYEKLREDVPDPVALVDLIIQVKAHHLSQ